MEIIALGLILLGVVGMSSLRNRSASEATGDPKPPPVLDSRIRQRVQTFRQIAADETEGLFFVSPALALAIIAKETGGISRPGDDGRSVGLMQVQRGAWQDYMLERNDPDATNYPTDLESPRINIRVGAWYLNRMIANYATQPDFRYHGIRAYNCGFEGSKRSPSCGADYARWVLDIGEPAFRATIA